MNQWGVATWGEPCRECGFSWALSPDDAVAMMAGVPAQFRQAVGLSDGTSVGAGLSWSVAAYVCHVADNLRISAERLVGAARGGDPQIAVYDQDHLAAVRHYDAVAIQGALWSLERAVADWVAAMDLARACDVVFDHPERGRYTWMDVASSNLHDALHHEFDVRRILASTLGDDRPHLQSSTWGAGGSRPPRASVRAGPDGPRTLAVSEALVVPAAAGLSLDQAIQRVTTHDDVEGVVLLGSTATGELNVASDYDIMLVTGDLDGLTVEVTSVDGRLTDVLVVSLRTLRRAQRGDDELSCRIAAWVTGGRVVFDRGGTVLAAQSNSRKRATAGTPEFDHATERWQISYDLLVNENYGLSIEPRYRLAMRLRSLHSFSRLLLAYFRVRRALWQGEKWAIRFLEQHDREFLRVVVEWLDAPDSATQLVLHRRAAEAALAPAGGVWPTGTFPSGRGFWERLTRDDPSPAPAPEGSQASNSLSTTHPPSPRDYGRD